MGSPWYLYEAGAAVDGRWEPGHSAVTVHQHIDIEGHIKVTIVAAGQIIITIK